MALDGNPLFERLTDEQKRIVSTADVLAQDAGMGFPDTVRMSRVALWPGTTVEAAVIDASIPAERGQDPDNLIFSLDILDENNLAVEGIAVALRDGHVTQTLQQIIEVYRDNSAPDYAITSFFDRFPVDKAIPPAQTI